MSPTSPAFALRSLAVIGTLSLAAFAAPAGTHAQARPTGPALLNHVAIPSIAPRMTLSRSVEPAQVFAEAVSGERALLASSAPGPRFHSADSGLPEATPAVPVDGARALLGRGTAHSPAAARRRTAGAD